MVYAYIRVSTGMQTVENQRHEIETRGYKVDHWIEETKSGTVDYKKRSLYDLMKKLQEGDTLICSEISRLGRSLFMIIEILNYILKKKVTLITIKENFKLDDSISSKVISFAFGLSSEIERNLISQRTKEALALRKAMGMKLGRPLGSKNKNHSLVDKRDYIINRLKEGKSNNYIKRHLHCHVNTLKDFLRILEAEGALPAGRSVLWIILVRTTIC